MPANKSALSEHVLTIFETFKQGRTKREERWNEARDNFHRVFKPGGLKANEGQDWRSKYTAGTVQQKVRTLFALMVDSALQDGSIPFKMFPKNAAAHNAELTGYTAEEAAAEASEKVAEAFERCHADRTYMNTAWTVCLYGEGFTAVTSTVFNVPSYVPQLDPMTGQIATWEYQENEVAGDSWDHASIWEMFCDPEAGFDPRAGRGVIRRVMMSPAEIRKLSRQPLYATTTINEMLSAKSSTAAGSGGIGGEVTPHCRPICAH